ncbi:MAG: tetratricopeptide repeat protein [Gemmataceae bacterium]
MDLLFGIFQAHPAISLAQTAFMIWMLVDAYRRQTEIYWYWLILAVPFVGAWVYFFAIKLADFRTFNLGPLFQRKIPLEELRYRALNMPTLTNHVNLARRLMELDDHEEAIPHLQAALKQEPDHPTALYSLAQCHKDMGHPELALEPLEKLLARDCRYSNYAGWHLLIETRALTGNQETALDQCRKLARVAPTLQHQCLLAEHLLVGGQHEEARTLLEHSLQDHAFLPGPIRRRNRTWAYQASRLHKRIVAELDGAKR